MLTAAVFVAALFAQPPASDLPKPWVNPGFNTIYWIPSPNFGPRPKDAVVDTVVVHSTVINTLEATTGAFLRESSQVSAHYTIDRDGSIVYHVSNFDRAWHAGVSVDSRGKNDLNNFSIGIELVNLNDGKDPYPDAQLIALGNVIGAVRKFFPIGYVTTHEFIAQPQGRKSDPANFPWERFQKLNAIALRGLSITHGRNPAFANPDKKP